MIPLQHLDSKYKKGKLEVENDVCNNDILSILLAACSNPIESFKGLLISVESELLVVDCADAVYRDKETGDNFAGAGGKCEVEINNDTEIVDGNKNMESVEKLKVLNETAYTQMIKVVLSERRIF